MLKYEEITLEILLHRLLRQPMMQKQHAVQFQNMEQCLRSYNDIPKQHDPKQGFKTWSKTEM